MARPTRTRDPRPRGAIWEFSCAILGLSLGPLGGLLGLSWALLPGFRGLLGAIGHTSGGGVTGSPRRSPQVSLLRPSWAALGAVFRVLEAVLALSCASGLSRHLGPFLRPQEPVGRERDTMHNIFKNNMFFKDFGFFGASFASLEGCWSRPGAVVPPRGGILKAIMNHLRLSCRTFEVILGLLGPSRSHLGPFFDALPMRGPRGPGPGKNGV